MRLRRARTLVVLFYGSDLAIYNYLNHEIFTCDQSCLSLLSQLDGWTEVARIITEHSEYTRESVASEVSALIEVGCLVVEGTEAAALDQEFEGSWLWGPLAGVYHFGTRNARFLSVEEGDQILRERAKTDPSPPLFTLNTNFKPIVPLPAPRFNREPFLTLARRRTNRNLSNEPVALRHISDALMFSLGITGILENPGIVDLPIKMTPSGGARNPYEAYVCVRRVSDLPPGTYHYSAIEHTLGTVSSEPPPSFTAMLADQPWTETAAAVIFLVANFERAMWKYRDPGAYRVVIIEVGHIAQNIMLVATKYGLVANPTCAYTQDLIERTLGLTALNQSVVYAVVVGRPASEFEWDVNTSIRGA